MSQLYIVLSMMDGYSADDAEWVAANMVGLFPSFVEAFDYGEKYMVDDWRIAMLDLGIS